MKKLLTLLMLLCMSCMGAWAETVVTDPTALDETKWYTIKCRDNRGYAVSVTDKAKIMIAGSTHSQASNDCKTSVDADNVGKKWIILKKDGAYYFYNIKKDKWLGTNDTFSDTPTALSITSAGSGNTGNEFNIKNGNNYLSFRPGYTWSQNPIVFSSSAETAAQYLTITCSDETVDNAVYATAYAKVHPNAVSEYQAKIDAALSHSGQVGYPTDMSSLNQYATNGVTNQNVTAAITAYDAVYNSTDIKLPEAGHVYSIMAYFKNNQNLGRYVTNATGTAISAPTTLATDGTAYWLYTNSKFQNKANAANYIAGAEGNNMSVNTSGTAFTLTKGLEFGTICIKGGRAHHAVNPNGAFGRYTGNDATPDKRQNSGTDYTTDFMITEVAYYVNPSTDNNPVYYTIKNKNSNRNKFVTASLYGADNMLTQETNASAGSYWYFEDASSAVQVDGSKYQPIYIRNAKLGGYLTTVKNGNATETVTKDAEHKEVFYLRLWDNAENANGYVVISRTAAKTTGTSNEERNSWSDSSGQGTSIDYWKSQDAGTPFLIERVSTDITSTIAAELTSFEASDYVGDYIAEKIPNTISARETYQAEQTAANLNALRDAYTQEFYWADGSARRTISTDKFYVIESACSAFTDGTVRAIYADYGSSYSNGNKNYPDYLKWKNFSADDNSFIFRFQAEKHYDAAVTWTTYGSPAQTATDVYSIYNVAAPQNAYVGVANYDGRYGMRKRGELAVGNSNNGSARGNDGGIFAVLPVAGTTNQFAIVARFQGNGWTENKMDCSTMAIKQGSNPTANTASGDVYTYNTAAAANDYHAWRIREVEAPVLEKQAVSISSVKVATFYTGKTLEIPEGVTAKKVVDAQDPQQGDVYHLVYEELQGEIPAGTAVVLFGEPTTYQFPRSLEPHDYVVTSAAGSAENRLIGTLNNNAAATGYGENGTLYALGNKPEIAGVAFYHFLSSTVTAGKAYLDARGINDTTAGSSVRAFAIFDEDAGTVTNIDALTGATISEGVAFDLAGRRVKASVKGISIVNGKKVIR